MLISISLLHERKNLKTRESDARITSLKAKLLLCTPGTGAVQHEKISCMDDFTFAEVLASVHSFAYCR